MQKNSPLRYPGGKAQMGKPIAKQFDEWGYVDYNYIEPFAGGSAVALYLLYSEMAESIWINDLDYGIYTFWTSSVRNADAFIQMIEDADVNIETWHHWKNVNNNKEFHSDLEVGFSTFFLNRTNYSGIIDGSPIGGFDQSGNYKIDCRFNKKELIRRIEKTSAYTDRIRITNLDARAVIKNSKEIDNSVLYVDPPYVQQGSRLYYSNLKESDHKEIKEHLFECGTPWILTYDRHPLIEELYESVGFNTPEIRYSARKKRTEREILIAKN